MYNIDWYGLRRATWQQINKYWKVLLVASHNSKKITVQRGWNISHIWHLLPKQDIDGSNSVYFCSFLVPVKTEVIYSSETLYSLQTIQHYSPQAQILHSKGCENLWQVYSLLMATNVHKKSRLRQARTLQSAWVLSYPYTYFILKWSTINILLYGEVWMETNVL